MKPKKHNRRDADLFRERLDAIIDMSHTLIRLARMTPWSDFDEAFGKHYKPLGRPAKPTRLIVGLHYLKHMYDLSDEEAVERWVDNPHWQYFCGFEFFQHRLPIDPSTMAHWRKRFGPQGTEQGAVGDGWRCGGGWGGEGKQLRTDHRRYHGAA